MVKIVVGEERQLKLAEDRLTQSGLSCEVGLVIGKLSSKLERGFVFDLVQTPRNDARDPACSVIDNNHTTVNNKKKGSSSSKLKQNSDSFSPFLSIDTDWVSEHARQVSRMLLGGMKVVGIYIWANESTFKNSTLVLCQTVKGVAEAAQFLAADMDESLLIHISYSPRRWTCRNCNVSSNITSGSLRPCDFKMGKALASLQTFRCTYSFDMRLPIYHENRSSNKSLAAILHHGIANQVQELKAAKALIDEKLVIDVEQCASEGLHDVEFLVPFMQNTALEASSQKEVVGVLTFKGSVYSFAYINSKEPVSQALADIKGDILTSLQSRLDIICDEEDSESDSIVGGGAESRNEISTKKLGPKLDLEFLSQQCNIAFPRRVFVPWLADTYICDYIQPSETLEVLKDHFVELMAMVAPIDASKILEPETVPTLGSLASKSFWDMVIPNSSESKPWSIERNIINAGTGGVQNSVKTANFNIIAAVLTLIISIFIGLTLLFFKGSSQH